jgi:hypothetical protein
MAKNPANEVTPKPPKTRSRKSAAANGRSVEKTSTTQANSEAIPVKPKKESSRQASQRLVREKKAKFEAVKVAAAERLKKKKKRKPHATRPSSKEEVIIAERRSTVWELRKARLSVREIAAQLKAKGFKTHSVGIVWEDIQFMIGLARQDQELSVKDHIAEQLAILDEVHRAYYPILKRRHIANGAVRDEAKNDAADYVMMAAKERAKLLDLYKPKQIQILDNKTFAQELGIDLAELPDLGASDADEL